ncbi:MAG: endonuclease/exonuclease/phosphatase family protein [Bacteroidales bacterium]|nr:endonuclease/exonuclease/phosphatase family protein [Bacteroidales bacterium]
MNKIAATILSILAVGSTAVQARDLCVMHFNIWQEGTMVPGGFEALADEIARQNPDIVMLSEVRNYNDTRFCDRITEALAKRGAEYHSFYTTSSGLLSRTEVTDSAVIFPYNGDHGSVHKLVTEIDGHRVAAYTAHLDYLNDTYYEVRGYDGNTWKQIEPVTDPAELNRRNLLSQRDEAAESAAKDIAGEIERGSLVFLGGDLNEPSGLDWTEATAAIADHNGVVINWPTIDILHKAGLVDTYREIYPDPVEYPGYTYPSSNEIIPINKLSWALGADERDRIDYIFYVPDSRLKLESVNIVGPQRDIIRGERVETEWGKRDITAPIDVWPSDHRAVVARFTLD